MLGNGGFEVIKPGDNRQGFWILNFGGKTATTGSQGTGSSQAFFELLRSLTVSSKFAQRKTVPDHAFAQALFQFCFRLRGHDLSL